METTEFQFHKITMADKHWMDLRFAEDDRNACEYTFANNFIWRNVYQVEVTEIYKCALIRFMSMGSMVYSYPIGAGEKKAVIEKLLFLCHEKGQQLVMMPLCEADRRQLLGWFPNQFLIWGDRDDYDYIYSREKLATLSGKKLHGKRNHIARFMDDDDWSYEPMTMENLEACRTMTYTWMRMRAEKWNREMEQEVEVLHEAFDHFTELCLIGGVLRKKDQIVAFTIGEPLNSDTFVVHFEKAFPDMQGAYPMINQQFVKNACENFTYVNREEDTGDLGLRKAKMSYYPEILLKKYVAKESEVVFADRDLHREQIQQIWQTCFGDDKNYIDFYMDHRMTDETMLAVFKDGRMISMASFLPVEYRVDGVYQKARYVYAVATLPEYRGHGYARKIIEFSKEFYRQPLLLAPASETLVQYYQNMGFYTAFKPEEHWESEKNLRAAELPSQEEQIVCSHTPDPKLYQKIRDRYFERDGYVRWDIDAIGYALEENVCCGGHNLLLTGEEGAEAQNILMYRMEQGTLQIIETTLTPDQLRKVIPKLVADAGAILENRQPQHGMLWTPEALGHSEKEHGYLNLTLG